MRSSFSAAIRICLLALIGLYFPRFVSAQNSPPASPSQQEARAAYDALLRRVQQGDMNVDFQAFRIFGAIVAGPHIGAVEVVDRAAFKKFMSESNPQAALESSNRTLGLDYASAVAHYDAMMACRALNKTDEAATHEKLLNALLDSMAKVGDGKTLATSYFASTTQEEYIFMALRLNLRPKGQQSLVVQTGHFYDLLKVIDPKTNFTQDLWFNVDVQMNAQGNAVPNPASVSKDSTAPVVAATAQAVASAQSISTIPSPEESAGNRPPIPKDPNSKPLRQIAGDKSSSFEAKVPSVPYRYATSGAGLGFDKADKLERDVISGREVYNVGGNVTAPIATFMPEAKYSDKASQAKYQGVCIISLVVDEKGKPQDPLVIRALGMGLDETALEAVRKYRFKPALKDGKTPVPVRITIEVNFRTYQCCKGSRVSQ